MLYSPAWHFIFQNYYSYQSQLCDTLSLAKNTFSVMFVNKYFFLFSYFIFSYFQCQLILPWQIFLLHFSETTGGHIEVKTTTVHYENGSLVHSLKETVTNGQAVTKVWRTWAISLEFVFHWYNSVDNSIRHSLYIVHVYYFNSVLLQCLILYHTLYKTFQTVTEL